MPAIRFRIRTIMIVVAAVAVLMGAVHTLALSGLRVRAEIRGGMLGRACSAEWRPNSVGPFAAEDQSLKAGVRMLRSAAAPNPERN